MSVLTGEAADSVVATWAGRRPAPQLFAGLREGRDMLGAGARRLDFELTVEGWEATVEWGPAPVRGWRVTHVVVGPDMTDVYAALPLPETEQIYEGQMFRYTLRAIAFGGAS